MWKAILAAALLCLTASSYAQPTSNSARSNASAEQTATPPKEGPTVLPAVNRQADALEEAQIDQRDPYAEERNKRERRDVIAQEDAAYWSQSTFWMMLAQTALAGGALIALVLDLRQNRRSAERQLRAYLAVDPAGIFDHGEEVGGVAGIVVTNTGQTPAYDLEVTSQVLLMPFPVQFDPDETDIETHTSPSDISLGAGRKTHLYHYFGTFPEESMAGVRDETHVILCFGKVAYRDAFKQLRETRFCHHYRGKELNPGSGKTHTLGNRST